MHRIIHMSDLHVGNIDGEDYGRRYRRVIQKLKFEKADKADEYVIIMTGDLVDNAHQEGRRDEVLAGINELKAAGFNHILVVPGNHDYGTGDLGNSKFVPIFKKIFYGSSKVKYPRTDVIGDIAFIGLDSMAEELHWYDALCAQGELGDTQLKRLANALRRNDVKKARKRVIYLHHHPFDAYIGHALRDDEKLRTKLQDAIGEGITIDAILYGHNHEGYCHNGHWGVCRCYDAGTATLKPRPLWLEAILGLQTRAAVRVIRMEEENPGLADYELKLL